jgi:hypothetical protein
MFFWRSFAGMMIGVFGSELELELELSWFDVWWAY